MTKTAVPPKEAVYLPLDVLDTPFRRQRLIDLGWRLYSVGSPHPTLPPYQFMWVDDRRRLSVMEGRELHAGEVWHHVSMSQAARVPTWEEFAEAKRDFIGEHVEAYLVHPPRERYVNFNPRVLHWYANMDRTAGVLPDFRVGMGGGVGL